VLYPVHISLAEQFAGALCMGVTSESVCMLREMVSEEVRHFGESYTLLSSSRG
jgi:hypothetical protein